MATLKEKIYNHFVNKDPAIQRKYRDYKRANPRVSQWVAWLYLLKLHTGDDKGESIKSASLEKESARFTRKRESLSTQRLSVEKLVNQLKAYDVISFDLFDTLILRPVEQPEDLFYLMGERLNYLDFKRLRMECEQKAREKKEKQVGHREVTLKEIWETIESQGGLHASLGQAVELETEKEFCFANPYMLLVLQALKKEQKKIIAISDMYFTLEELEEILQGLGLLEYLEKIYVSSKYGMSKSQGDLYEKVQSDLGESISIIHVGDNHHGDITKAEQAGLQSYHYVDVHTLGLPYRSKALSMITGSLHNGLVNGYIHNGLATYSKFYELGFIYGGLFVEGYCRWIHKKVKTEGIDQILFLARDGEILKKAYTLLYPEEGEHVVYAYWSRTAGTKLCYNYYKRDFFLRFLEQKVNQGYALQDILESLELVHILPVFLENHKEYTKESSFSKKLAHILIAFLLKHWTLVKEAYEPQIQVAEAYYKELVKDNSSLAIVDIGWAASGAMQLDYLFNQVWRWNCKVTGLIAGTSSLRSDDAKANIAQVNSGKICSYLYGQDFNKDIWAWHNPGADHNVIFELLLSSPSATLLGFTQEKEDRFHFARKQNAPYYKKAEEIQQGILDYIIYSKERLGERKQIAGRDAYMNVLPLLIHSQKVLALFQGEENMKNVK